MPDGLVTAMLKDLILKNRSYRGFNENRKLTREELAELVDCARLTASTGNIQPLKYYIAWEPEEVRSILALTRWARALPQIQLPHPGMGPTGFVIILQDTRISGNTAPFLRDCGIAAQTMLLRAAEIGLGGCMIGSFKAEDMQNTLSLPEYLLPVLTVAIGEPAETVVLTELEGSDSTNYYRDEQDIHYVPKRKLEDVLIHK